jgi:hypothetical protein
VKVVAWLHGAVYRVRQFGSALATRGRPLAEAERTEVRVWLPAAAWPLFDAMPHNDQHHSLNVLRSLRAAGHTEPALMQAALLHDAAKSTGGVIIFHRIAVVLLKVARPDWAARLTQTSAPSRGNLRYPFWVLANHPQLGAELAAAAGCDPLAMTLIRRHQETGRGAEGQRGRGDVEILLTALQAADDDN